jgi:hypothetical protein
MAVPRVLAGPIVRRVEPASCSFWVALSEQATITARVWHGEKSAPVPDSDPPLAEGQLATRRLGARLHVAVVTIDTSGTPLRAGERYSYDLRFALAAGVTSDLRGEKLLEDEDPAARITNVATEAPLHRALGFEKDKLPSFLAPPSTFAPTDPPTPAAGLRIAHASCRRPGSGAVDTLPGLAKLVKDEATRPHQLYLTGDQIYADDIATPLLPLVAAIGAEVAGAQSLPGFPPDPRTGGTGSTPVTGAGLAGTIANLPAMRRKWLIWQLAGFTGSDTQNHLITFPEFVAHYLLAWSPRVWRAVPAFADAFTTTPVPDAAIAPWLNRPWFCGDGVDAAQPEATLQQRWSDPTVNTEMFAGFNRSAHQVARYAASSPAVAQVLANTPTYLIFDDHEVADDWNLNGRWVARVYGREWGRFIVRNGLMAYTLMQAWGNDPAHFAKDQPGRKLLDGIPAAVAPGTPPTPATTADVDVLLGFDPPTTAQPKRVRFNFDVKAQDHKVVVLDTRTHRDVSNLSLEAPNLITSLDQQLPERSAADANQLLIVVSPVPVVGPAVIEQLGQPLAQLIIDFKHDRHVGEIPGFGPGDVDDPKKAAGCEDRVERGAEKYDREAWSANEPGFEALLARLASYPAVVLLSGDVHYACTVSIDRWVRNGDPRRIVQCTSSASKNVFKRQVEEIARHGGNLQRAEEIPVERLAWNEIDVTDLVPDRELLPLARRARLRKRPALVPSGVWPKEAAIPATKPPDWSWRLLAVVDTITKRTDLPTALRPAVVPADDPAMTIPQHLRAVATVHQTRVKGGTPMLRRIVFEPNFCTVQFAGAGDARRVEHRIHSATSIVTFNAVEEDQPLPPGRPPEPTVTFGPHTVHRVPLRTPADATPPTLVKAKS